MSSAYLASHRALLGQRSLKCSTIRRGISTTPQHHDHSLQVAVIGSGPAGFYTSHRILSTVPNSRVDMYEALPVPFGLVRYGVAPDHPEVKNCRDRFQEIAASSRFRFIGNLAVGQPHGSSVQGTVELSTIRRNYNAVVLAYGAGQDKELGIPGEKTLEGIYSARQFVGWYNGLPEFAGLSPNLTKGDEAIIIGNGNVALDVARILSTPVDQLRHTDIAEEALAKLSDSCIKRIHVVGRRGPMQASFTIKEIRELMKLANVHFHPTDRALIPEDLSSLPRPAKRLMDVIIKGSQANFETANKSWSLDFCLSPLQFLSSSACPSEVAYTEFSHTALDSKFDPSSASHKTDETIRISSQIVFRSTGYKSVPLAGFAEAGIYFDDRSGIVKNDGLGRALAVPHRLVGTKDTQSPKDTIDGLYCSGWVKRGPTGVIASTMQDAFSTADTIINDWNSGLFSSSQQNLKKHGWASVRLDSPGLQSVRLVDWTDWEHIDRAEKARGLQRGKEREKFTTIHDMLAVLE